MKERWIVIILLTGLGGRGVHAQVYDDFRLYADFGSSIKHAASTESVGFSGFAPGDGNRSGNRGAARDRQVVFGGSFSAYFHYSLFYEGFYFALAPQVNMERSRPGLLLKELLLSYSFDALELGVGKTAETRYLTAGRDYLTVRNRIVPFGDDFSFWKLSVYLPLDILRFEVGSKLVRGDYRFEWEGFEEAFSKHYAYTDLSYRGISAHLGYAYTYDFGTRNHEHDLTGMLRWSLRDVLAAYQANLLVLRPGRDVTLEDYSYTAGAEFSPLRALGAGRAGLDLKLFTELIYEKEQHGIAPGVTFYADAFSLSTALFYGFEDKLIRISSRIQYDIDSVSFRLTHGVVAVDTVREDYKRSDLINSFALELSYEF